MVFDAEVMNQQHLGNSFLVFYKVFVFIERVSMGYHTRYHTCHHTFMKIWNHTY